MHRLAMSHIGHSCIKNRFLIIYYSTCFKVKIMFDHFGSQNYSPNSPLIFYIFWKIDIKDINQANFFCFLLVLSLYQFDMEKIISKFQTSISWSKERWRSYICIPSGAQTYMMTHTKREPRGRPRDPFLCRKTILETIKSVSISDYYKYVFLHTSLNNSCLLI